MMQEVQRNICFNLVLFLFGNQWYFFIGNRSFIKKKSTLCLR